MGVAVIAHCDARPVFEFSKHVFDLGALFISGFALCCRVLAFCPRRDARGNPALDQSRAISVTIVAFVAKNLGCRWQISQQCSRTLVVGFLALGQQKPYRAAFAVANGVQFAVQPTFSAPDKAGNIPLLAGCTRCGAPLGVSHRSSVDLAGHVLQPVL